MGLDVPCESDDYPGFFHIPGVDTVIINRQGRVIDLVNLYCPLIKTTGTTGYPTYNLHTYGTLNIHRLLALTFIPTSVDPAKLHVNHIDGDKMNYELDNLEWVTPSENLIHAYKTGLRTDNTPVLVKDLQNEEIYFHYSLVEAARFLKVNHSTLHGYLNRPISYPIADKYAAIYEGNVWSDLTAKDIGKGPSNRPRPLLVESLDVPSIDIYESASHCAAMLNLQTDKVGYAARSGTLLKGLNCRVHFLDSFNISDLDEAVYRVEKHKDERIVVKKMPKRVSIPIEVLDIRDNTIEWWESIAEFAKSKNQKKSTIQVRMSKFNGIWRWYQIKYLKDQSPST